MAAGSCQRPVCLNLAGIICACAVLEWRELQCCQVPHYGLPTIPCAPRSPNPRIRSPSVMTATRTCSDNATHSRHAAGREAHKGARHWVRRRTCTWGPCIIGSPGLADCQDAALCSEHEPGRDPAHAARRNACSAQKAAAAPHRMQRLPWPRPLVQASWFPYVLAGPLPDELHRVVIRAHIQPQGPRQQRPPVQTRLSNDRGVHKGQQAFQVGLQQGNEGCAVGLLEDDEHPAAVMTAAAAVTAAAAAAAGNSGRAGPQAVTRCAGFTLTQCGGQGSSQFVACAEIFEGEREFTLGSVDLTLFVACRWPHLCFSRSVLHCFSAAWARSTSTDRSTCEQTAPSDAR